MQGDALEGRDVLPASEGKFSPGSHKVFHRLKNILSGFLSGLPL